MKSLSILSSAVAAAGYLLVANALAAPPAGSGMAASVRTNLVRIQAAQPTESSEDRMSRLRQHRSVLQNALQPPRRVGPAEAPEPQARALQPPEPMTATAPPALEPADEGQGRMSCEAAERIVADFGFSDIATPECSGDLYRFSAMRDGTAWSIGISAATGEIAEVSRQ